MAVIRCFGPQPPSVFGQLKVGGTCPHCSTAARFNLISSPNFKMIGTENIREFIGSYVCDACSGPIAVQWSINAWQSGEAPIVDEPRLIMRTRESFNFDHVPDSVAKEINEALDCLSVNGFNGFAALCRRTVQAICTDLGAGATAKVKQQIEEMVSLTGLGNDWKELALQIMLCGHDGAHPHLPDVDQTRAALLLSLVGDLTYQLYTRPGTVRAAAALRSAAIAQAKT